MNKEYPDTIREFFNMFPNEQACLDYLTALRWPAGYICSKCETLSKPRRISRNRIPCPTCRHKATVTADTIFDKTRTPLTTWIEAAWHVAAARNGISAKALERTLGTSNHVALMMLHRFRVVMAGIERAELTGRVQIDEALIGGEEYGGKTDNDAKKDIAVIAVEILDESRYGRTQMRHIPDVTETSLIPFIQDSVSPYAVLETDGWSGYNKIEHYGYTREIMDMSDTDDFSLIRMPGVHRLANLLKRWILCTYQGSVSGMHLQAYLDEYTFRFNNRNYESQGLLFKRLLEHSLVTKPITQNDIIGGYWNSDDDGGVC